MFFTVFFDHFLNLRISKLLVSSDFKVLAQSQNSGLRRSLKPIQRAETNLVVGLHMSV